MYPDGKYINGTYVLGLFALNLCKDNIMREDLITIGLVKYDTSSFGFRNLSSLKDRFALDFGYYSIIIELWFLNRK